MNFRIIVFATVLVGSLGAQAHPSSWFSEMRELIDELERMNNALTEEYVVTVSSVGQSDGKDVLPVVSIDDSGEYMLIKVAIAEVDRKAITARIEGGILRVCIANSIKEIEFMIDEDHLQYTETTEMRAHRSDSGAQGLSYSAVAKTNMMSLPHAVSDWNALKLTYEKQEGVLTIRLPKKAFTASDISIDIQ